MSLKFLSKFPGGNGRAVRVQGAGEDREVVFAADPGGSADALWFCFRILETSRESPHPDKLTLTLAFTRNMAGFECPANCCLAYQPEGKNWFRTGGGLIRTHADGQVAVSWQIPYPAPSTEVALCYPYGREELEILVRKSKGYWQSDAIGLSAGGRRMLRLSNDYGKTAGQQPGLYFVARQHAGHTPGSWVLDGVLERLSREKKSDAVVWTVPLADTDGVVRGRDGGGVGPLLAESWGGAASRHEAHVIQKDLRSWASRCAPALVVDFQSPGGTDVRGIRSLAPAKGADAACDEAAVKWAHVIRDALGEAFADPEHATATEGAVAGRSLVDFVRSELAIPCLVLQVPYARCRDTVMNQKQYREAGRLVARAVLRRI